MKIAICGAGIAGLALAHRLHANGAEVVVLERSPRPRRQGYMLDFFGPGYEAAERMGLLPRLQEHARQVEAMSYVDETGRGLVNLDYTRAKRSVGGRLLSLTRPDLEQALRESVAPDVELRFGCEVTGVEQDESEVRVRLADGETLTADLLVGADGVHSTVRRLAFGPEERFFRYLGFHTAAYIFRDPVVHRKLGGRFVLTDTIDRQMSFYGVEEEQVTVFAVHRTPDPELPGDPRAALRATYASLGWIVPRALEQCPEPERIYYDQVAQIEVPDWSRGRVVLLGDACHAVSLLAGQGASLAVAGAYLLAEQLSSGGSVESALERHQALLQPLVAEKQRAARRVVNWFVPSSPVRRRIRRAVLRLANLPGGDRALGSALVGKSRLPDPAAALPEQPSAKGAG